MRAKEYQAIGSQGVGGGQAPVMAWRLKSRPGQPFVTLQGSRVVGRKGVQKGKGLHVPVEVLLSCKHQTSFYPMPRPNDTVYCIRCADWRTFVTIAEWKVRCKVCKLSHRYGDDEPQAKRIATRHVNRFPAHVVSVLRGIKVQYEVVAEDTQLPAI